MGCSEDENAHWSTNVQTPLGIITRLRRLLFTLAAITALLAALLLSWTQIAAADTKPTIKFSYYSSELEEDSQRHLYININPPLESASTALIIVLTESEVRETLSGDSRAADMGYTNTGYAERNVDYTIPSSVDLPAGEKSVGFQFTVLGDEIVEGEEIFILKLVEFDGSPYTVTSDVNYSRTRVLVVDDEAPVLPDNLGVTMSIGGTQTDTGLSSKVTIKGDCPPAGGLRVQMKRPNESWPEGPGNGSHVWPGGSTDDSIYSMNEITGCRGETGEISVDGIAPGEEWDVRAYVWQSDTPNAISTAAASEFSQVYRVIGWGVPSPAEGVTLDPGVEQIGATWTPGVAIGTGVPVTAHIRWRTSQVGTTGQTDYAAAGPWNAEEGVTTDTPTSHTITGLTGDTFYDVEVRSVTPVGNSSWSLMATAAAFRAGIAPEATPVPQPAESDTPADSDADATPVTLPNNLSVTMSKGNMTTPAGTSSKVTITGDCPPNGGGFRFQMKRSNIAWPTEDPTIHHETWPGPTPAHSQGYPISEFRECGARDWPQISEVSVDGISPGEEWDVRVYARRFEANDDSPAYSGFSQVYRVVGWSVPGAPTGVSVTPGQEQLAVTWTPGAALGTDMPVTAHIRWRTAQVGNSGETGYAAAGPWNAEDGVATDTSTSHTINGLADGTNYDVEVRATSPMGSSLWAAGTGETSPPDDTDGGNNDGNPPPDDNGTNDDPDTDDSTQEFAPVPVVTFGHEKTGEGEYWASVNEGDTLTVTLTFTPALAQDSSIRWYNAAHHGEHGGSAEQYGREESSWLQRRNDYVYNERPAARDIALTAGMTSATFTIDTIEDTLVEGNESFHVHLCGPPPRCEWPFAPPEPHPSRQQIIDQLEANKDHYQDVKNAPELIVTIVDDDAPGPVGAVTLTATADSVTASWTAPASGGAESYLVHLNPVDDDASVQTAKVEADQTTVTFNNLESGTAYQVKVLAENDAGKSEWTISRITLPEA